METEVVRISLSLFLICFSTQSFYETNESFNCYTKKVKYIRQYSANCEVSKRTNYGMGFIDFFITKSRLPDKFREIGTAAMPVDILLEDSCVL